MEAKAFLTDVTSELDVEKMFFQAAEFMGGIDIFVNFVGGYREVGFRKFEDIKEDEWNRVIELNLKSVYLCCKAGIPFMKVKGWGRIIDLGSLAGRSPSAGTSPAHYASAKGAVSILTQYIAREVYHPSRISVQ